MGKASCFAATAVVVFVAGAMPHVARAVRADLVLAVDTEADELDVQPGDGRCATARGHCALRAAIQEANAKPGRDRVVLPQGFFEITIAGSGEDGAASGDFDIGDDLDIVGAGRGLSVIFGNGLDTVFHVLPSSTATLRNMNIEGGLTSNRFGSAGGILNEGTLLLSDVDVLDNVAAAPHGTGGLLNVGTAWIVRSYFERNTPNGIWNVGKLEIHHSVLLLNGPGIGVGSGEGSMTIRSTAIAAQVGNAVFCQGGLAFIERSHIRGTWPGVGIVIASGEVTVRDSIVETNQGGGINNDGLLRVERSTLRANGRIEPVAGVTGGIGTGAGVAGLAGQTGVTNTGGAFILDSTISGHRGGGLVNEQGRMTLVNVTISGNSSDLGGGITNYGELEVRSSTITANRSEGDGARAGGLAAFADASASVRLSNTIIAGNYGAAAPDCSGPITSEGYNLIGSRDGCAELVVAEGDLLDGDPSLEPLADNGGPTLTHALWASSIAMDAGSPVPVGTAPAACPPTDQRGAGRPQGASCDIGAFEVAVDCGDSVLDSGEACDDGNLDDGDCCSSLCRFEPLPGDCDASGAVSVAELLRAVRIALGEVSRDECAVTDEDGDGQLSIREMVRAVHAALEGCQLQ